MVRQMCSGDPTRKTKNCFLALGSRINCVSVLLSVSLLILDYGHCFATTEESAKESKFGVWKVSGGAVQAHPAIATHDVQISQTEVAPSGFPIGEPLFTIEEGETVDIVDIFPNDGESGYTCKVRNHKLVTGFVICPSAEMIQWLGDRGALVRILLDQPYEYEGDLTAPANDMAKLSDFIDEHPSSRFVPSARLYILSLRCGIILDLVQEVWQSARDLKERGLLPDQSAKINVKLTPRANQLYTSLDKQEDKRLQEVFDLCELVTEFRRSVPAPVSSVEK